MTKYRPIRHPLPAFLAGFLPWTASATSNTYSIAQPSPKAAAPAQLRAAPGSIPTTRVALPAPARAALEKVRKANDAAGQKRLQVGVGRALEGHQQARGERLQWQR